MQNTADRAWRDESMPSQNCGVGGRGLGSEYRSDSATWQVIRTVLPQYHPRLVFINLKEPDEAGHAGNRNGYVAGIRGADQIVYHLWQYLQSDEFYRARTALFITNDHGRHLEDVGNGIRGHGDDCEGCRHLSLIALGPDFPAGHTVTAPHQSLDLPVTVGRIMGFRLPDSRGQVLGELFAPAAAVSTTAAAATVSRAPASQLATRPASHLEQLRGATSGTCPGATSACAHGVQAPSPQHGRTACPGSPGCRTPECTLAAP